MSNAVSVLESRGLLEAVTNEEVRKAVEKPLTVYAGFDPSSHSLAIGNYVTIMALAYLQRCGHRVIALVGGATGMIGDPSGKSSERNLLDAEQVERNVAGIRENLSRFLDFNHPTAPARLVNNRDWLGRFTLVEFLRDVGRHFRLGAMLGKESVRARLESEAGISFTEFSYQLLQAYDFLHLYDQFGCTLQIGGSDQWGNITAGVDLVRKLRGQEVYGLTFPLVCDSAGQKFGKSEGNAVYLDHRLTPYYDFYQFFFRVADAEVVRLLRLFTFVTEEELATLAETVRTAPESRQAQKRLAEEVTRDVHGEHGLRVAQRASSVLFGETMDGLCADDLLDIFANVPSAELPRAQVAGASWVEVAAASGLCKSKGEARRLIQSGGLYANNRRVSDALATVSDGDLVEGRLLVLRSGKRTFHLVKVA
jgi:tyrosyl-tRNA synthetase